MPKGPLGERIPFEGVLNCWNDDHDLPDLLLAISRSGKTGRLQFSNPEGDKTLDLRDGRVVFAESSSQDDGLGQYLLRAGEISLMDYIRVAKMVQPGKRLGALLVEERVLHEENLTPAVIGQVRSVILGLFRRTESWYRFKEEELEPTETITLDLAVPDLVLQGVCHVESWRRISKGVGNLDSVYQRAASYEQEWESSGIGDDVRELISMLASPTSLHEICEHATLPDFVACRYLWAFRSLGWIDLVDVAAQVEVATATPAAETPAQEPVVEVPTTPPAVAAEPFEEPATFSEEGAGDGAGDGVTESAATEVTPEPPKPKPIPESLIETQFSINTDVAASREEQPPPESPPAPAPVTPRSIPESLIQTQVSVTPPAAPADVITAPSVATPLPPPRPIPDHLNETQLSVDAPLEEPQPTANPIPDELHHTQMFVEPPEASAIPVSTGEFMESILEGETPPPPASLTSEPERPAPAPVAPPTPSAPVTPPPTPVQDYHATTQFFVEGPSALTAGDPVAASDVAPVNEPVAAPVAKPTAAPVTKPAAAPVTKPAAAPVTKPAAAPVAKPTAAPVTKPAAAPVTETAAAPDAEPVAAPDAKPLAAPITTPAAASVAEPIAAPVAEPADAPDAEPDAEPVAAPITEPVTPPQEATTTEPTEAPSGFEALASESGLAPPGTPPPAQSAVPIALVEAAPAPPDATFDDSLPPNPADVMTQPSVQPAPTLEGAMASFSDLALSDDGFAPTPPADAPPLPIVEVEAVAVEPQPVEPAPMESFSPPIQPQPYTPDEPLLPRGRGMDITQESLVPPRRRGDDLDPESDDLGQALGIDEK